MRQIFLDTETTGLNCKDGHRIIEFGAVEVINRRVTGKNAHFYFRPDCDVSVEAFNVHGLSNEFLNDKPLFKDKVSEIISFIKGSQVIIHNAPFDLSFLDNELFLLKNDSTFIKFSNYCNIIDSLTVARKKHPGKKNSLDALCVRYGVNNKRRVLHGALLDAELLAEVYLMMTIRQDKLLFTSKVNDVRTRSTNLKNAA